MFIFFPGLTLVGGVSMSGTLSLREAALMYISMGYKSCKPCIWCQEWTPASSSHLVHTGAEKLLWAKLLPPHQLASVRKVWEGSSFRLVRMVIGHVIPPPFAVAVMGCVWCAGRPYSGLQGGGMLLLPGFRKEMSGSLSCAAEAAD